MKNQFEQFLIRKGYKLKTPSGSSSTISQYMNSIEKVCKREGYSWNSLVSKIDVIVRNKYDVEGAEEDFGNLGHKTVINALKLFQEFASITP